MPLTYDLLLKLSGGDAAVVERLTKEEREALWVDTPVAHFLRQEATAATPRHVFLSGSAGDGKTTLMQMTRAAFDNDRWHLDFDASTKEVHALADELEGALANGRRLFVAINRGQLERLAACVRAERAEGDLRRVVDAVTAGLRLRVCWDDEAIAQLSDVVTIDLSLQDTLAPALVDALLNKACGVIPPTDPRASAALAAARATLSSARARERIQEALQAVQRSGHHVTMRDLWGFASHLLTGGIADPPQREITRQDHVGCRLFSASGGVGGVPFVALVARYADPARTAWPAVTRRLMMGDDNLVPHPLGASAGAAASDPVTAADVVRALWIEGEEPVASWRPQMDGDIYAKIWDAAVSHRGEWLDDEPKTRAILAMLAAFAGDPEVRVKNLPAWRRLAYEDRFREVAPAVANARIDVKTLRLGIPCPAPAAQQALGDRALVPFIWLADSASSTGARLRLTPWLLAIVEAHRRAEGRRTTDPRAPEVIALRHWLARLPTKSLRDEILVVDRRGTQLKIGKKGPFHDRPAIAVIHEHEG